MSESERKPLLGPDTGNNDAIPQPSAPELIGEQPPPYVEEPSVQPQIYNPAPSYDNSAPQPGGAPDFNAPPPAYNYPMTPNTFVQCRVCQHVINVPQNTATRVVKCTNCNEATPVTSPPPGKKYVRCPCNCLLTCSVTATRVICPRANCKRTIMVGGNMRQPSPIGMDRIRVNCGHCRRTILWPGNAAVARCPHCSRRSYVNHSWMQSRAIFCFLLGALMLIAGLIVTGVTAAVAASVGGVYVISVGLFVSAFVLIVRGIFYCVMTRSVLET
ncbi:PREDICTED: type 1 phosphatidylinositol 4,5-bisphosphate 4-phosphatase-like [Amphimedon queenslandica]|uniref:Phosphatidylinositol-4,5-bisphosphate 4-phosphatase n=1 Tax=Amphimedon queenslandica TaxID=400682 RepID=A0A1X7VFM9_AMPQE|nr:PREDICTED: type 1 phosphatidylinositol 4,5-bisphosphate 4-phosphatase-like [Amphimedon queenslandica]|eukprot:XP_003384576.1 PREDICTED: type 1 phosphatidylinositol 4,5-bisphosphate 4-phosphatase-like [Amphimedon queenslandica]